MIKFNIEKLSDIIKKVYLLSHIKVSIFDTNMEEILYYPTLRSPFCSLIRSHPSGDEKCIKADEERIKEILISKQTKQFICPHGLVEVFAPILFDGVAVGVLVLGQIFLKDQPMDDILEKVAYLNIDENLIKTALSEVETIQEEHLQASAFLARICSEYVCLDSSINLENDELRDRIINYIENNISSSLTAEVLCKEFFISKVTLYAIFEKYFHTTVARYIREKRIKLAKKLIEQNPSMQISQICVNIGIDANYLPKIFKKEFGINPKKLQKKN